jgi:hypothetical protein
MLLRAHASSPPKKQLIGCGSKFLGEEDALRAALVSRGAPIVGSDTLV